MQLLIFNEEFLVSVCHQRTLITSLPFVHTARRSYRLNDPVRPLDWGNEVGSPNEMPREVVQTLSFRGRRSRNKVSVGEPAEGSLTVSFHSHLLGIVPIVRVGLLLEEAQPARRGRGVTRAGSGGWAWRGWFFLNRSRRVWRLGSASCGGAVLSTRRSHGVGESAFIRAFAFSIDRKVLGAHVVSARVHPHPSGSASDALLARASEVDPHISKYHNSCRWISWLSQR